MKIFIIEDDTLKSDQLQAFIMEKFPAAHTSSFGSFQSGLKALEAEAPDLVLLDITLPTFDRQPGAREGRLRPLGGYELLSKLKLKQIKTQVIIVTGLVSFGEGASAVSFQEIETRCTNEFQGLFLGMIYYQQMSLDWQNSLSNCMSQYTTKETPCTKY